MKKGIFVTTIASALFFLGMTRVQARVSYGGGYYTNLCGGGTNAETYTCSSGCNPSLGRCQSNRDSVVKWTCAGRLNQCGQNESGWANEQNLTKVECDRTVQISLFEKKCRMSDGSWDASCVLGGYMVWYSGACNGLSLTLGYSATPSGSIKPTIKPTVKPTVKPSVAPSLTMTPGNATGSGIKTTPETGPENIWGWILILAMAGGGGFLIKASKKVI